jgi:hypothetical protein
MLAKMEANQERMDSKTDVNQKKMEATVHSISSDLEETIKHQMENVLLCVD